MSNENEILAQLKARQEALQKELKALEQRENELRNQPDKIEEQKAIETQKIAVQVDIDKVGNEIKMAEEKQKMPEPDKGIGEKVLDFVKITVAAIGLVHSLEQPAKIELPAAPLTQEIVCKEKNVEVHKPLSNDTTKTLEEIAKEKTNEEKNSNENKIKLAYEHSKISNDEKKTTADIDPAKKWEKEIDKKEQEINEKYDNKKNEIEKNLQKQIDYIEKKIDNKDEKETKTKELKDTIEKAKVDIEKEKSNEFQKLKPERDRLEEVKEKTRGMEEGERNKEIEKQRQLELERQRQQELERQRLLDAFNKVR